jgi:hypothetical protein
MTIVTLKQVYPAQPPEKGNFNGYVAVTNLYGGQTPDRPVSLLRSRLSRLAVGEIPGRFSSSLTPLFAPGRFATFLFSAR